MTAPDAGNKCRLASRISSLSSSDRTLLERFLDTLEARAATTKEDPKDKLRRRIDVVRSRTD